MYFLKRLLVPFLLILTSCTKEKDNPVSFQLVPDPGNGVLLMNGTELTIKVNITYNFNVISSSNSLPTKQVQVVMRTRRKSDGATVDNQSVLSTTPQVTMRNELPEPGQYETLIFVASFINPNNKMERYIQVARN
jgi:hypothetical protein